MITTVTMECARPIPTMPRPRYQLAAARSQVASVHAMNVDSATPASPRAWSSVKSGAGREPADHVRNERPHRRERGDPAAAVEQRDEERRARTRSPTSIGMPARNEMRSAPRTAPPRATRSFCRRAYVGSCTRASAFTASTGIWM